MKKTNKQTSLIIIWVLLVVNMLNIISAITIRSVSNSPQEVSPGEVAEIEIEIENIFEEDVFNLNVKLDLTDAPFAPYQSSSEKFLDELEENDEKTFNFKLIALPETASGIYKIPIEVSYEKNDEDYTKKGLISLIVNAKPEIKVSLEDSSVLIKGKENILFVKIINSGLADVKFFYLNVNDVSGIKILSEKEQYVGDIDSDDFDSVRYKIYVENDAKGTINLPVSLKFKDATNKEFTETKNLILKTYTQKEASRLGLVEKPNYFLYLVPVVLFLSYIIYRIRKKRKKKME